MIAVILYHIMLMNALLDECVQCHGMTTEDGSIRHNFSTPLLLMLSLSTCRKISGQAQDGVIHFTLRLL